jgi:hypothetical protein
MCESAVKVACPAAKDRALHRRRATFAWRHVPRIHLEGPVCPRDGVVGTAVDARASWRFVRERAATAP